MISRIKNRTEKVVTQLSHNMFNNASQGIPITFTDNGSPKSYLYNIVWDFSSEEVGKPGSKHTVSFANINVKYVRVIQETLFHIKKHMTQENKISPSSNQLNSYRLGLSYICEIMGTTNWSELDEPKKFKRFKHRVKELKLGKGAIEGSIVNAINKLHRAGYTNQLIDGRELLKLADVKSTQQAIAIPVGMYQKLLSNALEIIEKYHPYRNDISDVIQEAHKLHKQIHNGEDIFKTGRKLSMSITAVQHRVTHACQRICHNIPDFKVNLDGSCLSEIQVACVIIVLAFSGVRVSELRSFNKRSYKDKKIVKVKKFTIITVRRLPNKSFKLGANYINNFINIYTMATLVGKTTKGNNGIPKIETWQTHPVVEQALELAEDMCFSIRQIHVKKIQRKVELGVYDNMVGNKKLSDVKSAFISLDALRTNETYVRSGLDRAILKQAKLWGIKATEGDVDEFNILNENRVGTLIKSCFLPKLSPHDFRRTFAVFFRRYNFGSSAGIKFQFKHNNINMSKYYENNAELMHMNDVLMDVELLNELENAGIELGVDIYDEIYNKSEILSGLGGEVIAKERLTKLRNGHDIYLTRDEIREYVRNGEFAIVQLPTGGYCTNTSCDRLCGITQFKAEQKPCIHQIYTDKSAKKLAQQRKRLVVQFRGMNNGDSMQNSILAGLKQKIQESEITLNRHKISYEKFQDIIKGAIV